MSERNVNDAKPSGKRLVFIDGLRGLAAISVALFHLSKYVERKGLKPGPPLSYSGIDQWGWLGVEVFFVISGFVITYSLRDSRVTSKFFGSFVLRRILRLDPPYWALVALVVVMSAFGGNPLPSGGVLVAHALYLQNLLNLGNLSTGLWTLCLEVQFYVCLLLLIALVQRAPIQERLARLAVFTPLAAWSLWAFRLGHDGSDDPMVLYNTYRSLLPNYFMFFLGSLACWTLDGRAPYWGFWVAVAVIVVSGFPDPRALIAAGAGTVIFVAGRLDRLGIWLSGEAWRYLGRISYSLYLVHAPIGYAAMRLAIKVGVNNGVLLVGIGLAAAVFAANLLYRFVEKPSVRWSQSFRPTAPAN